jgi:hypothetical protein
MKRGKPLKRTAPKPRRPISPASPEQRAKVRDAACVVTGLDRYSATIDPMHLVDRSLGGCDDPLCVVPGSRGVHRAYDDGQLDLLPYLAERFPEELAHAVTHLGLIGALERITNERWRPVSESIEGRAA